MVMTQNNQSDLTQVHLTTTQLAKRLYIGSGTLAKWRMVGKGPRFISLGKNVLYPLSELEKWERSQIVSSTAQY